MVGATLSENLRRQYNRRSSRVSKGDSVKVMRGEYKGVEGKVDKVNTLDGTLEIEGIQREKVRGGQVKVPIHASKVMITGLKTDDKYRAAMLSGQKQHSVSKSEAKAKKSTGSQKKKSAEKKEENK
jgi:large subunit ribosomal protein L24